jgi:hypothetical protein
LNEQKLMTFIELNYLDHSFCRSQIDEPPLSPIGLRILNYLQSISQVVPILHPYIYVVYVKSWIAFKWGIIYIQLHLWSYNFFCVPSRKRLQRILYPKFFFGVICSTPQKKQKILGNFCRVNATTIIIHLFIYLFLLSLIISFGEGWVDVLNKVCFFFNFVR